MASQPQNVVELNTERVRGKDCGKTGQAASSPSSSGDPSVREGVGWSHPASHKVLLDIVLAYSWVVSGGGGRPEKMQGHLATR